MKEKTSVENETKEVMGSVEKVEQDEVRKDSQEKKSLENPMQQTEHVNEEEVSIGNEIIKNTEEMNSGEQVEEESFQRGNTEENRLERMLEEIQKNTDEQRCNDYVEEMDEVKQSIEMEAEPIPLQENEEVLVEGLEQKTIKVQGKKEKKEEKQKKLAQKCEIKQLKQEEKLEKKNRKDDEKAKRKRDKEEKKIQKRIERTEKRKQKKLSSRKRNKKFVLVVTGIVYFVLTTAAISVNAIGILDQTDEDEFDDYYDDYDYSDYYESDEYEDSYYDTDENENDTTDSETEWDMYPEQNSDEVENEGTEEANQEVEGLDGWYTDDEEETINSEFEEETIENYLGSDEDEYDETEEDLSEEDWSDEGTDDDII